MSGEFQLFHLHDHLILQQASFGNIRYARNNSIVAVVNSAIAHAHFINCFENLYTHASSFFPTQCDDVYWSRRHGTATIPSNYVHKNEFTCVKSVKTNIFGVCIH